MNSAASRAVASEGGFLVVNTGAQLRESLQHSEAEQVRVVVVEAEGFVDFDYDPSGMLEQLVESHHGAPRHVIAARTDPGSRKSQDAFIADFMRITGAGTMVVIVDAVARRLQSSPEKSQTGVDAAKVGGIEQSSQWPAVVDYAKHLLAGGAVMQFQPVSAEAIRLVEAMYRPGTGARPLSDLHKRVLVALADSDSSLLHKSLGFARKTISNSYGPIAQNLGGGGQVKPLEFCSAVAGDYRSWLRSYGRRKLQTS
jgi:hypothetical protein